MDALKISQISFDALPECLLLTDLSKNIIYVNPAFFDKFSHDHESFVGKNLNFLNSKKNSEDKLDQIFEATLSANYQGKCYFKSGEENDNLFEVKTSLIKSSDGQAEGVLWLLSDITKEENTRRRLEESVSNYHQLFDEIKDTVYQSSPDGKLFDINPAGLELFDYDSKEELMKVDIANDLYVNPEDRAKFREILERDGYVKDYELAVKKKNGQTAIVLETSFIVKDRLGKIKCFRGILRDVTQTKKSLKELNDKALELSRINKDLENSERKLKKLNASKDKFFSIIAHDLRSPFASLIGLSELLIEDIEVLKKEDVISFSTMINEAANELLSLLENLLQWSRVQADRVKNQPISFYINDVVADKIRLLHNNAKNKSIEVINKVQPKIMVYADYNMLNSVVQNLLSNAIKFTNEGGRVEVLSKEKQNEIELTVEDTGIGIDQKDIEKLFADDIFHTTKGTASEPGTGLGLKLCKELVEKNKGILIVDSTPGEGSKFIFTLPKGK